jgi:outer membrane receptor protein involved in Fe transport
LKIGQPGSGQAAVVHDGGLSLAAFPVDVDCIIKTSGGGDMLRIHQRKANRRASTWSGLAAVLLSALATTLPALAHAQTKSPATADEQNNQLMEIVVTAQKRAENIQDVPFTVQAFSGTTLRDSGIQAAQDLQLLTPGLIFENTGQQSDIYLRGIGTFGPVNG